MLWDVVPKNNIPYEYEVASSKNKDFENFDHFWKILDQKWSPKSKFCSQQFFGHGKSNTFWKFQNPSLKTEGGVPF